jgi:hypothetical protein
MHTVTNEVFIIGIGSDRWQSIDYDLRCGLRMSRSMRWTTTIDVIAPEPLYRSKRAPPWPTFAARSAAAENYAGMGVDEFVRVKQLGGASTP